MVKFLNSLVFVVLLIISCEDSSNGDYGTLNFDIQLDVDTNGFYHLPLDKNNWQTLHRVFATIKDKYEQPVQFFRMDWESNLYWFLGDTLGYVVKRGLTDELVYVSYDTVYITGFNGTEVPTSNQTSYSNSKGELNNMIAPVRSMLGDTLYLTASWLGGNSATFGIVLD